VTVCAPSELQIEMNNKNLSVGATVKASAPSIQRRSIKYNIAVSEDGSPLAFVIYIKDAVFPPSRCDLVRLGCEGTLTYYMFLLGNSPGVDDDAAGRFLEEVVNPLLRAAQERSQSFPSASLISVPAANATSSSSSSSAAAAAAHSSSDTREGSNQSDDDGDDDNDEASDHDVDQQRRRQRAPVTAESCLPAGANPQIYH